MMGMEKRYQSIFSWLELLPISWAGAGFLFLLLPSAMFKFSEEFYSFDKLQTGEWSLSFFKHLGEQTHHPLRQELSLVPGYGSWNIFS